MANIVCVRALSGYVNMTLKAGQFQSVTKCSFDDKIQEGDFTYASDGKPIEYTNWNPNEPRTGVLGVSEDCVILKKSYGFKWNDAVCSLNMSFICERDEHNYGNWLYVP